MRTSAFENAGKGFPGHHWSMGAICTFGIWASATAMVQIKWNQTGGAEGPPDHGRLKITWKIPYHCDFGHTLGLVGKGNHLGDWNPSTAIRMTWSEGDVWIAELDVEYSSAEEQGGDFCLEYKYLETDLTGRVIRWQDGGNHHLRLPSPDAVVDVSETWDGVAATRMVEINRSGSFRQQAAPMTIEEALVLQAQLTMNDLESALIRHESISDSIEDPSDMEAINADRVLASAFNKAVAFQRALRASENFPRYPGSKAR
eukprot:gene29145-32365_t